MKSKDNKDKIKKITATFEKYGYQEFSKLARLEERTISRMIDILVNNYKKNIVSDKEEVKLH
jgi:hypothetical protein